MRCFLEDKDDIDKLKSACEIRVVWDLRNTSDSVRAKNIAYYEKTYIEAFETDEKGEIKTNGDGDKLKSRNYGLSLKFLDRFARLGNSSG